MNALELERWLTHYEAESAAITRRLVRLERQWRYESVLLVLTGFAFGTVFAGGLVLWFG